MHTNQDNMSIAAYTACRQRLEEIELALESLDTARINQLAQELNEGLLLMQQVDSAERSASETMITEPGLKKEMALSMQARIEQLTMRIAGIMALQRNEMNTLKLGQETARGYATGRSPRTGSIINSAN